jgi:hypothetical protein
MRASVRAMTNQTYAAHKRLSQGVDGTISFNAAASFVPIVGDFPFFHQYAGTNWKGFDKGAGPMTLEAHCLMIHSPNIAIGPLRPRRAHSPFRAVTIGSPAPSRFSLFGSYRTRSPAAASIVQDLVATALPKLHRSLDDRRSGSR